MQIGSQFNVNSQKMSTSKLATSQNVNKLTHTKIYDRVHITTMGDGGSIMLFPDVTALPGTFSVGTCPCRGLWVLFAEIGVA